MPQQADECAEELGVLNPATKRPMTFPGHTMVGRGDCSCGYTVPLGQSVFRSFDTHLIEAGAMLLSCGNTMCRVHTYLPHSSKAQDQKCPACYGRPEMTS